MKKLLFFITLVSLTSFARAQWQQTSLDSNLIMSLAADGNNIYAGCSYYGMYLSTNNGNTWTQKNNGFIPTDAPECIGINGNSIFAGMGSGIIYLSTDNCNNWNGLISAGLPYPISVLTFAIQGSTTFAGSEDHGIWLSSDNGISWTRSENGLIDSCITSLAVSGSDIYAGVACGQSGYKVYLSINNGLTWNPVSNGLPNGGNVVLAVCGSDIFVGIAGYGIYKSSNNGLTWNESDNGLIGFTNSINSLISYGNNLFAGSNGVYVSMDNGDNWFQWNEGLSVSPNILTLAVSNDTLFAGTYNEGVWKRALSEVVVGIKEINTSGSNYKVYPNHTKDKLTIESLQKSTIEILNIQGQKILQQQIQQGKTDIDISGLAKGVYILRLNNSDRTEMAKILKE